MSPSCPKSCVPDGSTSRPIPSPYSSGSVVVISASAASLISSPPNSACEERRDVAHRRDEGASRPRHAMRSSRSSRPGRRRGARPVTSRRPVRRWAAPRDGELRRVESERSDDPVAQDRLQVGRCRRARSFGRAGCSWCSSRRTRWFGSPGGVSAMRPRISCGGEDPGAVGQHLGHEVVVFQVVRHSAAMTEQVANRDVSADGRVRQIRRERRVEVDQAFVDELHHDRGDERLGETADPEHRIRRHRFAGGVRRLPRPPWWSRRPGPRGRRRRHRCRRRTRPPRRRGRGPARSRVAPSGRRGGADVRSGGQHCGHRDRRHDDAAMGGEVSAKAHDGPPRWSHDGTDHRGTYSRPPRSSPKFRRHGPGRSEPAELVELQRRGALGLRRLEVDDGDEAPLAVARGVDEALGDRPSDRAPRRA